MALKIDASMSATAYHITTGATLFPYAIDAQHAISSHPDEWSETPWTREDADAARQRMADRYEAAKEAGQPLPPPPPAAPAPMTADDQAALDQHNAEVAAAQERLKAYYDRKAKEKAEADAVAADEALVRSPPPQPDPTVRRPFGRTGEPTPGELKQIEKQKAAQAERERKEAEKAAEDERIRKEKAKQDKLAGN